MSSSAHTFPPLLSYHCCRTTHLGPHGVNPRLFLLHGCLFKVSLLSEHAYYGFHECKCRRARGRNPPLTSPTARICPPSPPNQILRVYTALSLLPLRSPLRRLFSALTPASPRTFIHAHPEAHPACLIDAQRTSAAGPRRFPPRSGTHILRVIY